MYQAAGSGAVAGGTLANTGFQTLGTLVGGLALVFLGFALLRTARRVPKSVD